MALRLRSYPRHAKANTASATPRTELTVAWRRSECDHRLEGHGNSAEAIHREALVKGTTIWLYLYRN